MINQQLTAKVKNLQQNLEQENMKRAISDHQQSLKHKYASTRLSCEGLFELRSILAWAARQYLGELVESSGLPDIVLWMYLKETLR